MCFHQAFWLLPNGDLLWTPETDDHVCLAAIFHVRDDSVFRDQRAVRGELKQPESIDDFGDLSKWTMIIDEPTRPDWVTYEAVAAARAKAEAIVERQIVRTDIGTVAGGCWIVVAGGRIGRLIGGRILAVQKGANLSEANLSRANLYGANLSRANLSRANLSRADLSEADLYGANLSRADLYGANLYGANLSRADLSRADLLTTDPVPDGWTRTDGGILVRAK